jgi:hypothetical protein
MLLFYTDVLTWVVHACGFKFTDSFETNKVFVSEEPIG